MVFSSSAVLHHPQGLVGVLGGIGYHFVELRRADVERAGTGDQNPSRPQHLHGTQVEFFIAAQGFVEVALGLGKGGRIENDGVVAPVGGGVLPQQVEGVALDPLQFATVRLW